MGQIRGYRYRLDPTPEQAEQFAQSAGVCRLIYNAALEQRTVFWRLYKANTGKHISYFTQSRELTPLRAEVEWVRAVSVIFQQEALRNLDNAFQRFFRGEGNYPTPHKKGIHDSFRFFGRQTRTKPLNGNWSAVLVPKIGWVKFRDTRPVVGTIKNATISLQSGLWFVSFACEIEHEAPANNLPSVGIDRGVANTITLSTGEHFSVPTSLNAIERRQRRAKRALSRKVRGSARYAKQRRRVAAMSARCARIRKDWAHRVTTDISRRFGTVVIEDLKIPNMTASGSHKRGLNRSILNQGWGMVGTMLGYKLEAVGGRLVKVNPAYTSQTCASCGAIDRENRKSQAVFKCVHCGHEDHADVNAALNIQRGSTPLPLVEAQDYRASEARTTSNQGDRHAL